MHENRDFNYNKTMSAKDQLTYFSRNTIAGFQNESSLKVIK